MIVSLSFVLAVDIAAKGVETDFEATNGGVTGKGEATWLAKGLLSGEDASGGWALETERDSSRGEVKKGAAASGLASSCTKC